MPDDLYPPLLRFQGVRQMPDQHVEDDLADVPKDELNALVDKYLTARKR